jgi:hypothetical protein
MISHNVESNESEEKQEVMCDKCCKRFDSMKSLSFHINNAHQKEDAKKLESWIRIVFVVFENRWNSIPAPNCKRSTQ